VFYHSKDFTVAKSQVTGDRPFVATQYGVGGEMSNLDAGGGWIISSSDFAHLLSAFDRSPAKPVFNKPETSKTLFEWAVWEGVSPFQNGKDSRGDDTFTRCKGGGFGGTNAAVFHRDDGLSVAAVENYDFWPADAQMSLSGVSETFHNFQINERLNLLTNSPAFPLSLARKWRINANGTELDLVIDTIDQAGGFKGKMIKGKQVDQVMGVWNKSEGKMTFTRQTGGNDPSSVQIYEGYLMAGDNRLAGSFEAFSGTGGTATRNMFGWLAWLPDSI
jgi:hypothetical protein